MDGMEGIIIGIVIGFLLYPFTMMLLQKKFGKKEIERKG